MTSTSEFDGVRAVASGLSLDESDFSNDAVTTRIAAYKREVDALDVGEEPWMTEWLGDEHYKAGLLYTAAKVNWNYEQEGMGTQWRDAAHPIPTPSPLHVHLSRNLQPSPRQQLGGILGHVHFQSGW